MSAGHSWAQVILVCGSRLHVGRARAAEIDTLELLVVQAAATTHQGIVAVWTSKSLGDVTAETSPLDGAKWRTRVGAQVT